MFAKIVVGVVLVLILPCESKHQKFVEVPFDDDTSTQKMQQFASRPIHTEFIGTTFAEKPSHAQIASFTFNEPLPQRHLHNHPTHNNRMIINPITTSRPQSIIKEEEFLQNSVLRSHFQDGPSAFHGHHGSNSANINQVSDSIRHAPVQTASVAHLNSFHGFPSSGGFTMSQPIQSFGFEQQTSRQPIHHHQFTHGTANHVDDTPTFGFGQQTSRQPTHKHQFIHETTNHFDDTPTFGFGQQTSRQPTHNHQFSHETINHFDDTHSDYHSRSSAVQQKNSKQPVNTFLGVEQPIFRFIEQPTEKPQRPSQDFSNIAHFVKRVQPEPAVRAPTAPPSHRTFHSQPLQINQQEVSQNPRFPDQPEFLINARMPSTPSRFFVNHQAPSPQEDFKNPISNLHQQNQKHQNFEEEAFRQQAESAKYSFASQIDDSINGNHHQREEVRDGLSVKGMYSYSDGYVKRTVFYEADDKGYRVVKEEEEPLGDGPQVNPDGQANVSSYVAGNAVQYSITTADIQDITNAGVQGKRVKI